jgi:hypothetical protein
MSIYCSVGLLNRLNSLKYEGRPCLRARMRGCPMCGRDLSWHVTTRRLTCLPVAKAQTACLDASPFPAQTTTTTTWKNGSTPASRSAFGSTTGSPSHEGTVNRVNIVRAPAKQECALTFAVKPAALAQHKSESVTSLLPVLACEVKGRERGWKWIVAGRMEGERGAREPIELEPMVSFAICLAHCLDGMQTHCRDHEMTCQCLLLLRSPSLCEIPCMKGANDYGRR